MKNIYVEIKAPERSTVKTSSSNDLIHINVFKAVGNQSRLVGIVQLWPTSDVVVISAQGESDKTAMTIGEFTEQGKLLRL